MILEIISDNAPRFLGELHANFIWVDIEELNLELYGPLSVRVCSADHLKFDFEVILIALGFVHSVEVTNLV